MYIEHSYQIKFYYNLFSNIVNVFLVLQKSLSERL